MVYLRGEGGEERAVGKRAEVGMSFDDGAGHLQCKDVRGGESSGGAWGLKVPAPYAREIAGDGRGWRRVWGSCPLTSRLTWS